MICSKFFLKHWLDRKIQRWLKQLGEYGVCIVKGVECKEGAVRQIAELIAPLQKTIYGEIFDVKVDKNPINIAYSDVSLGKILRKKFKLRILIDS